MTLAAFLAAALLHLLAAISPGPAVLMAARVGVTEGLRTGTYLALGLGLGAVCWATAALFGLALLFEAAPALLWGFKVAGGLYLLWMAIQIWRHAAEPMDMGASARGPRSAGSAFRLGVATQLANPKPAVFFGAIFVGLVPPDAPLWAVGALLLVIFLNEAVWNVLVARIFSLERTKRAYIGLKTVIDRVFGGLLAIIGLKLAAT